MDFLGLLGIDSEEEIDDGRNRRFYRERVNFEAPNDFTFNEKFRLPKPVFQELLRDLEDILAPQTNRSQSLSAEQQILLALHWLGTGAQQHAIGDMHGVSKATVGRTVKKVVMAINETLFDNVVKWPDNVAEVVEKFHQIGGMPCVVGAIDGTLINIDAPSQNEDQYVDRHGNHSITCMACVGPDREFFNVSANWPGSLHDARVLRNSNLFLDFEGGWRPFPNGIILGDTAYPLKQWLMTPVLRNLDDPAVRRYNRAHKSTRSIVENAFGILKEKFPCLNHLRVDPAYAGEIFKCCTILCNLSKQLDNAVNPPVDGPQEEDQEEEEEEREQGVGRALGEMRLQQLLRHFG